MEGKDIGKWIPEHFTKGLISVIIPTFNRASLLKEAIDSIVGQTYRPIECIIVDDGSTEDIRSLVEDFSRLQNKDFEIKYVFQENGGSQIARNNGTKASSGEYIQYLDSDDILYPDKIEKQVAYLQSNANYDAVFGNWYSGTLKENELVEAYAKEDLIAQMLTERCIANFSFIMRRTLIMEIGPWDISIMRNQEIDYHLSGLMKNARYSYTDVKTGLLRTHNETRITTETGTADILHFYQKWEKILTAHNKFSDELKIKFAKLYMWFFTMDIKKGPVTIKLLSEAIRLDPSNAFFSSKKLKLVRSIVGTKTALHCWLAWMIYNRKKQQLPSQEILSNYEIGQTGFGK